MGAFVGVLLHLVVMLVVIVVVVIQVEAQQSYVNNKQLDCDVNDPTTLGFVCNNNNNSSPSSCTSYLTFRSTSTYNSPVTIAFLLSTDASQIAAANNISAIDPLPIDTLLIIPVNCSCTTITTTITTSNNSNYYQHNASYTLRHVDETYFTVSNDTYQSLTTCQAMMAQNPTHNLRELEPGIALNAPLRCACPSPNQTAAGFRYLLTYLIRQGNDIEFIADMFSRAGADVQSILNANELGPDQLIFFFTPILVPLRTQPNAIFLPSPIPSPPPPPVFTLNPSSSSSSPSMWIFIGVGIAAAVLLVLCVSLFVFCKRKSKSTSLLLPPPTKFVAEKEFGGKTLPNWSHDVVSSEAIRGSTETLTVYKFEELEKATDSFSESNRINGSSSVYKGSFKGDCAVVKIVKGGRDDDDVSREIDVLRQINHSHILRLSGFCIMHLEDEEEEGIITYLVYEYAQNGSLSDQLHIIKKVDYDDDEKHVISSEKKWRGLDWKQRVQIAYDVADALNYLHNFTNPTYIHKNLKSSSILLDANMRAKVSSFGLARSLTDVGGDQSFEMMMTRHVVGTYGYMAPEYIENGLITPKLDVFAFGVVMLELLSGKEPVSKKSSGQEKKDDHEQVLLSRSIESVLGGSPTGGENVRDKLQEFMDPCLGEEYPLEMAYAMAQLARGCVAHNLNARPLVSEVFMALSKLLSASLDWDPSYDELNHSASFTLSD